MNPVSNAERHIEPQTGPASEQNAAQGAAVYTRPMLAIYDAFVIGFSNSVLWKCPSRLLVDFCNQNLSAKHLDVGVGTGYFLDKCQFPSLSPNLTLVDLNPNCLRTTARRLRRYHPACHLADVLRPLPLSDSSFQSIGLNYLVHCLPGDLTTKGTAFGNLRRLLKPGGVLFGATILGSGVEHGVLARQVLNIYNAKGIFSNLSDSAEGLRAELGRYLSEPSVRVEGAVALFRARG
jgi:ubiquinone/menaquinone biosynthesis C-methylase UbiE